MKAEKTRKSMENTKAGRPYDTSHLIIQGVEPGSIAEELELCPGDRLVSIDGQEIHDVLDYYFYTTAEELTLRVRTADGEEYDAEIEKEEKEDLGIVFADRFMGAYRHCSNHCIFCFIDQLPKGLRPTLYFKDDDSRLSFLNGNYITMTNMSEEDIQRILRYHMSPINVSVHTTDPELRVKMLKNPRAGEIMKHLVRLADAGIVLNAQIVLCKGVNDGEHLERTLTDLAGLTPRLQTLSVVPVGLTKYREGLYPLEPFTKEDAKALIRQLAPWQERQFEKTGLHFVHAADEFYILAEEELPPAEAYDGYLQIENGVGMMRSFLDEAEETLASLPETAPGSGTVTVVTAKAAAGYIEGIARRIEQRAPGGNIRVACIRNDFFGEKITVTGLLTGGDIIRQLSGQELGKKVFLPENLLRAGETVLLDDVTVGDLKKALHTEMDSVQSSGKDFVAKLYTSITEKEQV